MIKGVRGELTRRVKQLASLKGWDITKATSTVLLLRRLDEELKNSGGITSPWLDAVFTGDDDPDARVADLINAGIIQSNMLGVWVFLCKKGSFRMKDLFGQQQKMAESESVNHFQINNMMEFWDVAYRHKYGLPYPITDGDYDILKAIYVTLLSKFPAEMVDASSRDKRVLAKEFLEFYLEHPLLDAKRHCHYLKFLKANLQTFVNDYKIYRSKINGSTNKSKI